MLYAKSENWGNTSTVLLFISFYATFLGEHIADRWFSFCNTSRFTLSIGTISKAFMNNNPIYIVDDDEDDQQIIKEAVAEIGLKNELKFFYTAEAVLNELRKSDLIPFIIISDINLPGMDGFTLREKILTETSMNDKSIPFIFWSTTASDAQVKRAFDLSAHGFFIKGRTFKELKEELGEIISYWSKSLAPH